MTDGTKVYTLPIKGNVEAVRVAAYVKPDGTPGLFPSRDWPAIGSGQYHGVELFGHGSRGGIVPFAVLSPRDCRALATALVAEAARLEHAEQSAAYRPVARAGRLVSRAPWECGTCGAAAGEPCDPAKHPADAYPLTEGATL